ncbi:MAG: zinc-ribbon domain-containing protein [Ignavibacteriales bacterium]|nr:zinc-ribbon domain-containing protein [Ignavibacteriales bacterium]
MGEISNQKNSSRFYCSDCNTDVKESDKYCPKCGADLSDEIEENSFLEIMFCTKCGAKNKDGFNFCSSCGSPIQKAPLNDLPKEKVEDILNKSPVETKIEKSEKPYYELFIQENASYYLSSWELIESTNSKYSWNWSAFLFTYFWLLYRKMYSTALIVFIVFFIADLIFLSTVESRSLIMWIINLIMIGLFGGFGNYFYLTHTKKKLSTMIIEFSDEEQLEQHILKKGGISPLSAWMPFIIIIIIIILAKLVNQGNN